MLSKNIWAKLGRDPELFDQMHEQTYQVLRWQSYNIADAIDIQWPEEAMRHDGCCYADFLDVAEIEMAG